MNWYAEQLEKEMNDLEPKIRRMYDFLKREDTDEELKDMVQNNFNKMKYRYNELRNKLKML